MDDPLLAVHLGDLALPALVLPAYNHYLIVLADRNGAGIVLAAEVLRERSGHDFAAHGRGRREVGLAAFPTGGGDVYVE